MVSSIEYRVGMLLIDSSDVIWEIIGIDSRVLTIKSFDENKYIRNYSYGIIYKFFRPFCLQVGETFNFSNVQYTFHGVEYKAAKIGGVCLFKIKGTNGFLYITRTMLYNYI